jgi:hypothetical protein
VTDGRFSSGSSGPSIGHCSPKAAKGGLIGLVEDGEIIEIDIPERSLYLAVPDADLAASRTAMEATDDAAWQPLEPRRRRDVRTTKAVRAPGCSSRRAPHHRRRWNSSNHRSRPEPRVNPVVRSRPTASSDDSTKTPGRAL